MDTEVGFESPAAYRAFTEELAAAVTTIAAKYDSSAVEEPPLPRRPRIASGGDQERRRRGRRNRGAPPHAQAETTTQQRKETVMPRQQTHEIVIDAPIEAVWKAITDGEELTRWFVDKATVTPGVGGTISIAWGDDGDELGHDRGVGAEQEAAKEAGAHDMGAAKHDPAVPMIDEYTIERRDGKTVLRLVCSGIPDAKEWDGFYNGTDTGWESFLRTLRHYLEHNPGKPRTTITIVGKASGTLEETWPRLLAAVAPRGTVVFEQAPAILEMSDPRSSATPTSGTRCRARAEQFVYTILSVYGKSAGGSRGDPREMAAVARAGARRRIARQCRSLTASSRSCSSSSTRSARSRSKRMFGGVGLYAGDLFFALIAGDVLYLKADDSTARPARERPARGRSSRIPSRPRRRQ